MRDAPREDNWKRFPYTLAPGTFGGASTDASAALGAATVVVADVWGLCDWLATRDQRTTTEGVQRTARLDERIRNLETGRSGSCVDRAAWAFAQLAALAY